MSQQRPSVFMIGQKGFGASVAELIRPWVVGGAAPEGRDRLRAYLEGEGMAVADWAALGPDTVPDRVDLIVAVYAHVHIGADVRARARFGAIGYHPSLLPLHRGRDSIRWAIESGARVTGGTVYQMDDGYDTGPIVRQGWCFIRPGDDAATLWRRDLAPMGSRLIAQVIGDVAQDDHLHTVPQDSALATYEKPWAKRELMLGEAIDREPVAHFTHHGGQ